MMRMVDLIEKKKRGDILTTKEIYQMINDYMTGKIPDYQMSAFLMAVIFRSMNEQETTDLTLAMEHSGEVMDLSIIGSMCVDKHSTGGVGDKTTLVLAPLVASLGIPVAKMSGRGLGHTGGTLDKLESIPGFSTRLTKEQLLNQVQDIDLVITGQSEHLVPADQRLYALRDVTGTVDSIPLIASSVMSKKLACGADAILLDVKYGRGAFMKKSEDAVKLAKLMIHIGKKAHRQVRAMISDMNQPLGQAIGNMLEIREACETLQGKGPEDLRTLCLNGAAHLVEMAGHAGTFNEAYELCVRQLDNGQAWHKFKEMVSYQGGDVSYIENFSQYPVCHYQKDYFSLTRGYIAEIDSYALGVACMKCGAGRATKEESIDPLAGMILHYKVGEFVSADIALCTLYSNREITAEIDDLIQGAYVISPSPIPKRKIVELEVQ